VADSQGFYEMNRKSSARRSLIAFIAAAVVTFSIATVASAVVWKSGTTYCAGTQRTVGYSTGTTEHYPGPSGYGIFYNGSSWKTTKRLASATGGGFWFVQTGGSISSSGTYAECTSIT